MLKEVEPSSGLWFAWTQVVVAHFPLHASWIDPVAAGTAALLEDFVEDRLVKTFSMLRGE